MYINKNLEIGHMLSLWVMSDFEDEIKAELDALSDSSLQDVDDDLPINFYENEEIKEETRSEGMGD